MGKGSKSLLFFETDGQSVCVLNQSKVLHTFRCCLIREAEAGDGMMIADDLKFVENAPKVSEHIPWGCGGAIIDFEAAKDYLSLLRKRFQTLFRRPEWTFILSPYYLTSQQTVWNALLRESGIKKYRLRTNLALVSKGETEEGSGVFVYWGSSGFDIGCCLHSEVYRYERMKIAENEVLRSFQKKLETQCSLPITLAEVGRLMGTLGENPISIGGDQLLEVATTCGSHEAMLQDTLLNLALASLQPSLECVEAFLKNLSSRDHSDLFQQGLSIFGTGTSTGLLSQILSQTLEVPVFNRTVQSPRAIQRVRDLSQL